MKIQSTAARVARGFALFDVSTVQGNTLDISTDTREIAESVKRTDSCVVHRYSGETKQIVLRKVEGKIVFGSMANLR